MLFLFTRFTVERDFVFCGPTISLGCSNVNDTYAAVQRKAVNRSSGRIDVIIEEERS